MRILCCRPIVAMLCAVLAWSFAGEGAAASLSASEAINKAGRQRMLTQRIIKAYAQIHLDVTGDTARAQLLDAVERFDAQLAELKSWATDREVRDRVGRLENLWRPFRAVAVKPPSLEGLRRLMAQDEAVLTAAHRVVQALQDRAGTPVGRLVNVSGRQRMLSQRLAKFYLLRLAGLETPSMREDVEAARNEFSGAFAELRGAAENTDAIRAELKAVTTQWEWFRNALTLEGARSYALVVADSSESIMNSMDLVAAMYEALPAR